MGKRDGERGMRKGGSGKWIGDSGKRQTGKAKRGKEERGKNKPL